MVSLVLLLAACAPASAAPGPITGELSKPGYSVIAVAENGKGKATVATRNSRRFNLRPPAARVTLHLRGRDGVYVGPIVIAESNDGKRATLGVKAGTRLGVVRIDSRKRYGLVTGLARKRVDTRRWAVAKKGVPIGAGKFGLVRSRVARRTAPPGDLDADGVADPLDIDDNGNRVLDRYERLSAAGSPARAAGAAAGIKYYLVVLAVNADRSVLVRTCDSNAEATVRWPADEPLPDVGKSYQLEFNESDISRANVLSVSGPLDQGCPAIAFVPSVAPGLFLTLGATVNANAAAVTSDQFNDTLARRGFLWLGGGLGPDVGVELDCGGSPAPGGWSGGLSYCRKGGTGRAFPGVITDSPPRSWPISFPDSADTNGNGFGEPAQLTGPARRCNAPCVDALLSHGATAEQIGTGDVLNWRVTKNGVETQFPTTLPDVFATVPALVSYRDGAGNSATVSYPVQPPFVGSPQDYFGDSQGPYQGFPVAPCSAGAPPPCVEGDVVVTLEFWRPQRSAIPGAEEGDWIDIGGLVYTPGVALTNLAALPQCRASELSTTDPNLTPTTANIGGLSSAAGFRDAAGDRRADPGNTVSFSVNLTKCYPHMFSFQPDPTWDPGESRNVWLTASTGGSANGGGNYTIQALRFTMK